MNEPICFWSLVTTSHSDAPMLNRSVFLCVVRCFFVKDFACVPICVSKVFFCLVGCSDYSVNFWSTTFGGCGVLVLLGKAASFNGVALSINWTQIDTIGLIAASLSMVEAVSCTDVNPHADKLWGSEKTALCFCQGLIDWWSCTSPRRVKMQGGFSCHFDSGCCGGALLFSIWVRCLPKASFEPRFHHY